MSHYLPVQTITTFSNYFGEGKEIKSKLHSIVLLTYSRSLIDGGGGGGEGDSSGGWKKYQKVIARGGGRWATGKN